MKNKITLKIWLILFSIMILQGLLSTFSSFLYLINSANQVNFLKLFSQRIFSYAFWIILIPFVYQIVITVVKEKILLKEIFILLLSGILIAFIHRTSVIWINDQFLSSNPSQSFFSDLLDEKFAFLSLIYDSFFSYILLVIFIQIYRISVLRREAKIREESFKKKLVQAELKNLKMKFQPHFIFNSLHSISAAAYKNPKIADSMITKLSELLRYSINSAEKDFISVQDELSLAKKYIEIQKLRFGERINYTEEIDPITLNAKIPLFVFQPLLENCIKHAVELTDVSIRINIIVKSADHKLKIEITNNLPAVKKSSNKSLGEGLQNLRERLDYIYDGNVKLNARETNFNDFSVSIILPLDHER